MYIVIMTPMIAAVHDPIAVDIVLVAIVVAIIVFAYKRELRKEDEESAMRGPVNVILINQRSGEHKYVKVGFSWALLLFSGFLGIPLFVRRLYVWGGVFLALWVLYIFGPRLLAAQSTELGILSAIDLWLVLNIISLGLAYGSASKVTN